MRNIVNMKIPKNDIKAFMELANRYFMKLLRPHSALSEEKYDVLYEVREQDLMRRRNKALRVGNLIRGINQFSESELGNPFLVENLGVVLSLFEPWYIRE